MYRVQLLYIFFYQFCDFEALFDSSKDLFSIASFQVVMKQEQSFNNNKKR